MRKLLSLTTLGVLALTLVAPVQAQDAPSYTQVSSLELAPADAEAFLAEVKIVRDAALEAGLDAKFAWDVYRWDNTLHFVSTHESLAFLEDPGAMIEAFEGSDQAQTVASAIQRANALSTVSTESAISIARPDLSYLPANPVVAPGEQGGVYLVSQWPKGDRVPAFQESVKDLVGMLAEMGGPYPVLVSQNMVGNGGFLLAVPFDNLSNFYGENSLEEGLASSGMAEAWAARGRTHSELITRSESQLVMYLPAYSFQPDRKGM